MMSLEKAAELLAQARKKEKFSVKLNKPVFVRHLIVTQDPVSCYGESQNPMNFYKYPEIQKLLTHIQFLLELANEEHRSKYCEKDEDGYQIKKDKKNHITQLTTQEFSFYTSLPLKIKTFHLLLDNISEMAKMLEPNVHILLSSFAVVDNRTLFNISLFIEGGEQPVIHPLTKKAIGKGDISYGLTTFDDQDNTKENFSADFIGIGKTLTLSLNSVIDTCTFDGTPYTAVVDICIDNYYHKGIKALLGRHITENQNTSCKTDIITHCIVSNSIPPDLTETSITLNYIHVDPQYSMSDHHGSELDNPSLEEETLLKLIPEDFEEMLIKVDNYCYIIEKPPFGSKILIEILEEEKIENTEQKIKNKMSQHNNKILNQRYPLTFYQEVNKNGKLTSELNKKVSNIKYLMPK